MRKLSIIATLVLLGTGPLGVAAMEQSAPATQTPPATQTATSDEQLSAEIATKIANDEALSADAIKVTVKKRVVTLSGMVGKDADKARAEELARIPGVTRVQNNLRSREKAADKVQGTAGTVADKTVDVSKKAAKTTKKAVSKTGEVITDGWILSRIKTKFAANDALRASAIDVDVKDNVVTLNGAVPTEAARAKALELAKEVEGVDRVVDNLKVTSQAR